MPNTARGITYPTADDHTRLWEHLQTLAQTADTAISNGLTAANTRAGGTQNLNAAAANTYYTINVAFPAGRFTAPPAVVPAASDARVSIYAQSVTKDGFNMVWRSTVAGAVGVGYWIAQAAG